MQCIKPFNCWPCNVEISINNIKGDRIHVYLSKVFVVFLINYGLQHFFFFFMCVRACANVRGFALAHSHINLAVLSTA